MFQKKEEILRHDNFVEDGAIRDYILKEFDDFIDYIPTIEKAVKSLANNLNDSLTSISFEGMKLKDIQKLNDEVKKSNQLAIVAEKVRKAKADATAAELKVEKEQITVEEKKQKQQQKAKQLTDEQIAQAQRDKETRRDRIKLLAAELVLQDKTAGTLQKLEAANTRLRLERKKLNADTAEGKKRLEEINAEIDRNNKLIIEQSDQIKKQKLNVGNYTQSIKDAAGELFNFGGVIGGVYRQLNVLIDVMKASREATIANAAATTGFGKAMTSVKAGLKTASIGAAALVAVGLAAYFKGTEEGAIKLESTLNSIEDFIRILANRIGLFFGSLVQIVPAAMADISNSVKNGFNSIKDFITGTKSAKLPTDNFAKAAKGLTGVFKGLRGALEETYELEDALTILRRQTRRENLKDLEIIRVYASEVEKFNQVADDQTLSFAQREKATEDARKALQKSADAEVRIAERAVAVAEKELDIRKLQGKDRLDAEEKLSEALDKLDDAQTKRDILGLQNQQRARTIRIKQLQNEIDLIEKTFDKEKELRDKDIADQKKAFDERERLANELDALSTEKYQKEIALIADKTQKEIDAQKLINTNDEAALQRLIESLGLGDKAEDALRKAINNRKAEYKSFVQQMAQIAQGRAEDLEKQNQVEASIAKEQQRTLEINLENEINLQKNNLNQLRDLLKKRFDLRKKQLEADAAEAKRAVNADPVASAALKAKRIKEIELKLANDLLHIKNDYNNNDANIDEQIRKRQIDNARRATNDVTDGVSEGLRVREQLTEQAAERELNFQERTLEIQSRLAAEGRENTLAETQARIDRIENQRIQQQRQQARVQESLTLIKTFTDTLSQALDSDKKFPQALAEAGAATGIVKAVFSQLFAGSFKEGTEDTGATNGKGVDGQGGRVAIVHDNERILTKEQNAMVTGMSNDELVANAVAFKNNYLPVFNTANQVTTKPEAKVNYQLISVLQNEIKDLKRVIAEKPTTSVSLGSLGEWTSEVERNGLRIIQHNRRQSRWPSIRRNA